MQVIYLNHYFIKSSIDLTVVELDKEIIHYESSVNEIRVPLPHLACTPSNPCLDFKMDMCKTVIHQKQTVPPGPN